MQLVWISLPVMPILATFLGDPTSKSEATAKLPQAVLLVPANRHFPDVPVVQSDLLTKFRPPELRPEGQLHCFEAALRISR